MASLPDDFSAPEHVSVGNGKPGDEEEVATGSESENSSAGGEETVSSVVDGFQPSDDSSGGEQGEEGGDDADDGGEELEDLEVAGEILGDGANVGDGVGEDFGAGNGGDVSANGVEELVLEEAPLVSNGALLNQANVGDNSGGLETLRGEEAPEGNEDEEIGGGDENGPVDNSDAIVFLPDSQYQALGITEAEYAGYPVASAFSLDLAVVYAVALLNIVAPLGILTFPVLDRSFNEDPVRYTAYLAGSLGRAHAASQLRLDQGCLALYMTLLPHVVGQFAVGDARVVNLRAALESAGECVIPLVPRLRDVALGRSVNGRRNGGRRGGNSRRGGNGRRSRGNGRRGGVNGG